MRICRKVLELMKGAGIGDKPLFVGGIIPSEDAEELRRAGILEVFGPGTSLKSIIEKIEETVKK
jgi:methylmalonyl-CoA mutase C-terminal domain/subunit